MMKLDSDTYIAIIDVTGVQEFPVISSRENNWKLLRPCDVIQCNIMNYLIRRQNERYIMMSNKDMSTKENTLQLPPQFSSTSSGKSESETEYSSFGKRRKHPKENEIPLKNIKIRSLNGKFWSF